MSSLRVLFVRNSRGITDVTGAERYVLTIMEGLARAGCEVSLCCAVDPRTGDTPWLQALRASGLPHRLVSVPSMLSVADVRAALAQAREIGAQVVHAIDHRSDVVAVTVARRLGIPAVASFFGWTNWHSRSLRARIYPMLDKLAMRGLSRVLVDSRYIGEHARVPAGRLAVVPNGVDLARFDPERATPSLKQTVFGETDVTLVGMVGRIHPNKGHLDLAEAVAALLPRHPELRVVVIGAAPPGHEEYLATLTRRIEQDDLHGRFVVTNLASAGIPDAMSSFDIVATPSYMESLSYVVLEAMAMRKPVLSTRVGGHAEVITDGDNGLLIEPGDPAALATALERLIVDPALRERLGAAGRARVEADYSIDAMVAHTIAIYREAIGQ